MKWILIIWIGLLLSCNGNKKTPQTDAPASDTLSQSKPTETDGMAETSNLTKLFLKDLRKDMQQQAMNPYKPSDAFIEKYNLIQVRDQYFVGGFIKTNDQFDEKAFRALGANLNEGKGDMRTCQIPVSTLDMVLEMDGITYYQIAEKTIPK